MTHDIWKFIFDNERTVEKCQGQCVKNNEENIIVLLRGSVVSWLLLQFVRQPATSLPPGQYGLFNILHDDFSYYFLINYSYLHLVSRIRVTSPQGHRCSI